MTPHELTTLLAEPSQRQFDEPYKLMLLDRCLVWYDRLVRNTLEKDPRRRKEFLRPVTLSLDQNKESELVPAFLYTNGLNFDFVGSADGTTPFVFTSSPSNLKFFQHNKYQRDVTYYSFIGGKVQVHCAGMKARIRIDGIFINPKVVAKTSGLNMEEFMNTDMEIPGDIMQQIIQMMMQNDLRGAVDTTKDEVEVRDAD